MPRTNRARDYYLLDLDVDLAEGEESRREVYSRAASKEGFKHLSKWVRATLDERAAGILGPKPEEGD